MNRREAKRLTRQADTLRALGFTDAEAESLRRISMTLHRWHERECGTDSGCIERGKRERGKSTGERVFTSDENGAPYWVDHSGERPRYWRIPDREAGAKRRLAAILKRRNSGNLFPAADLAAYIQTDPRGAALYILRPGDVPEGEDASAYYNRGICVY